MNLILRLLCVLVHAFIRPRIDFWQESVVRFHVLPNDLDCNMHMTNSRYLSIMDLGRVDLLIRTGLGKIFFRHKWKAVLGAANIRFRQALRPFQEYLLYTRIMGFDEKWAYLEQRFESKGELVAYAIVKGVFIDHDGRIPMPRILNELGLPAKYPPLPKILQYWSQMDDVIKETFNPKQT